MTQRATTDDRLITTFGRLVEADSSLSRQLGRQLEQHCGISHTSFEVLLRISRAEGGQVGMTSLAQQVALTSGGITRLLDRLIQVGLVQRVPCPSDRRVYYAALTAAGQSLLDEAKRLHAANLKQVFKDFTPADLRELDRLLDKLRTAELR
jgi:MarR family 2-MHQ and catechol resistance regulon transcriptional repressor